MMHQDFPEAVDLRVAGRITESPAPHATAAAPETAGQREKVTGGRHVGAETSYGGSKLKTLSVQRARLHTAAVKTGKLDDGGGAMDASLANLAHKGASTVVALLATDAWERVKASLGAFWRCARPEQAQALEAELAAAKEKMLADGDETVSLQLMAVCRSRLEELLLADAGLASALQRLLDEELLPALRLAEQASASRIQMRAKATGNGRVYQAARDQHIHGS